MRRSGTLACVAFIAGSFSSLDAAACGGPNISGFSNFPYELIFRVMMLTIGLCLLLEASTILFCKSSGALRKRMRTSPNLSYVVRDVLAPALRNRKIDYVVLATFFSLCFITGAMAKTGAIVKTAPLLATACSSLVQSGD